MTTNNAINEHARRLAPIFQQIEDLSIEAKALVEIAEKAGISGKELRKVAKEMIMEPEKLAKRLESEAQLDMFRSAVGLLEQKGIAA